MKKYSRPSYSVGDNSSGGLFAPSLKAYAGRDEKLAAALCHLSILANLFTHVGGLVFCIVFYLCARHRALFLAREASRALIFQLIVSGLFLLGDWLTQNWPTWLALAFSVPVGAVLWLVIISLTLWRTLRCL